jgi:hypothetical protein
MLLLAALAGAAAAAGFENMNGEYVISKTPGASGGKLFNTKWGECEWPHSFSSQPRERSSAWPDVVHRACHAQSLPCTCRARQT